MGDLDLAARSPKPFWGRASEVVSDPVVVLCTQVANQRAIRPAIRLGFEEVDRFEEFGAEQWLGVRTLAHPDLGDETRALIGRRSSRPGGRFTQI